MSPRRQLSIPGGLRVAGLYENQDSSAAPIGHKLFPPKLLVVFKLARLSQESYSAKLPENDGLVALSSQKNATLFSLPNLCRKKVNVPNRLFFFSLQQKVFPPYQVVKNKKEDRESAMDVCTK